MGHASIEGAPHCEQIVVVGFGGGRVCRRRGKCLGAIVLSSDLPHEVELADPPAPAQADFDDFSWKSFVALNWPANADGTPSSARIGEEPAAQRVWEFYLHPKDVFLPLGATPEWKHPAKVGSTVQIFKAMPGFRGENLDALHFPVVDQSGNFVLFDMRLNRDEFDYILANGLYSKAGQQGPTQLAEKFVSFPAGASAGPVGAVEIKTAWRVLPDPATASDTAKRYYSIATTLDIPAEQSESGKRLRLPVTLGLIGFHIAHKTSGQPQWVWSTFEHVDNLAAATGKPTLTDPACTACPLNNKPLPPGEPVPADPSQPNLPPKAQYKWSASPPFAATNQRIPTQVKRVNPLKARTVQLNLDWQAALRNVAADSVWQNYQLINTQWPTKPFARKPGQLPGARLASLRKRISSAHLSRLFWQISLLRPTTKARRLASSAIRERSLVTGITRISAICCNLHNSVEHYSRSRTPKFRPEELVEDPEYPVLQLPPARAARSSRATKRTLYEDALVHESVDGGPKIQGSSTAFACLGHSSS